MKRRVYNLAGSVAYRLGARKALMPRRAAIAVFHRVDDRYPGTPITVTRSEFRQYLGFFRRYFDVVPLSTLTDALTAGRPVGGMLAITFDDGYLDNHAVAAADLEAAGLPACFFIATGFIGTKLVPHWDAALGIESEWMSWDDVRDLHRRGFEIGAHTVTHPDLGRLSPTEARQEADACRRTLEAEIGRPVRHFSYPFGRAANITEANREVIRDLGFATCMASHGGTVRQGESPFTLLRAPIHPWHLGPGQYGLELLFDRKG